MMKKLSRFVSVIMLSALLSTFFSPGEAKADTYGGYGYEIVDPCAPGYSDSEVVTIEDIASEGSAEITAPSEAINGDGGNAADVQGYVPVIFSWASWFDSISCGTKDEPSKTLELPLCSGLKDKYMVTEYGSFSMTGTVTSTETLNKVTVTIINSDGIKAQQYVRPNDTSCNLSNITFTMPKYHLNPGTYTVKVWASTDTHEGALLASSTVEIIPELTSEDEVQDTKSSYSIKIDVRMDCRLPYSEDYTYKSSKTSVATVSNTGVVTTRKAGKTTVTIKEDGTTICKYVITVVGNATKLKDEDNIIVYAKNNAGLWYGGYISDCDSVMRFAKNTEIIIKKSFVSSAGHKWYITLGGYYIYSDDVTLSKQSSIVDVAKAELAEGDHQGGLKYRMWYYNRDIEAEWCANFVSYCADQCGYIMKNIFPKFEGCRNGVEWFKEAQRWKANDGKYEPKPGDIVFFDFNGDGFSDHVAIVVDVNTKAKTIDTIDGNSGSGDDYLKRCVTKNTYRLSGTSVLGFGISNGDY